MKKNILLNVIIGVLTSTSTAFLVHHFYKNMLNQDLHKIMRLDSYYHVLNSWLYLKNTKKELSEYFTSKNLKKIAIYGMGELGERFIEEIKNGKKIDICYAIDAKGYSSQENLKVYKPEENWYENPVDAIIVTPIFAYTEIYTNLHKYTNTPILSLEDILDEI